MDFLAKVYLPGVLALGGALLFALVSLAAYVQLLAREDDEDTRRFARRAYGFFALAVLLGAGVLVVLLLRRDFRIEYVSQYSGAELPWFYQFSAFWAGQKGSFLIWLVWGRARAAAAQGLRARGGAGEGSTADLPGGSSSWAREPFVMLSQRGGRLGLTRSSGHVDGDPPAEHVRRFAARRSLRRRRVGLGRAALHRWAHSYPGDRRLPGARHSNRSGYWAYKTLGGGAPGVGNGGERLARAVLSSATGSSTAAT